MASGAAVRAAAARAAAAVDAGRSLNDALAEQGQHVSSRDVALLGQLAYGAVRHRRRLDAILGTLLDRPLPKKAASLQALLRVGIFQLESLRLPAHAAVHATVSACDLIGARRARGLVNAILRRFQREGVPAGLDDDIAVATSHPDWLVQSLQRDWPGRWQALLFAANEPGPMTLRVALDRATREQTLLRLRQAGHEASLHPGVFSAVVLDTPCPVEALPGFATGELSVQDAAAQLAVQWLAPRDGERILDACAAPGGKTGHLLEAGRVSVTAVDVDASRLQRVADNLQRLGREARLLAADAAELPAELTGYDAILLDAPCSGSGVIRRHPDIKWLRRETDIAALAQRQLAMLDALWPRLNSGGRLLYCVCSVLSDEGEEVIEQFCSGLDDAYSIRLESPVGESTTHGLRIGSAEQDMDGFYYALLRKAS